MSGAFLVYYAMQHCENDNVLKILHGKDIVWVFSSRSNATETLHKALMSWASYNEITDDVEDKKGDESLSFQCFYHDSKGKEKSTIWTFKIETYNNKTYVAYPIIDDEGNAILFNIAFVDQFASKYIKQE